MESYLQLVTEESRERITVPVDSHFASGYAGRIYEIGNLLAAKIYDQGKLTPKLEEKLRLLISKTQALHPNVVAPRELVCYDGSGAVAGFTMRYLPDAEPIHMHRWHNQVHDATAFDQHVADLLYDLCDAIETLHENRVYVADLKPDNILVSDGTATIVDFDSCSFLPEYPGNNFTEEYVDPLLKEGDPLSRGPYDFNAGSDWWALAVVAFELFLGISPWEGNDPEILSGDAVAAKRAFAYSAVMLNGKIKYPAQLARTSAWLNQNPVMHQYFQSIFSDDQEARYPVSRALEESGRFPRLRPASRGSFSADPFRRLTFDLQVIARQAANQRMTELRDSEERLLAQQRASLIDNLVSLRGRGGAPTVGAR